MREFGASEHKARKSKDSVDKSRVLILLEAKRGQKSAEKTENLISNFYTNDDNSRLMPGKKAFISVKKLDGTHEHPQKRLIMFNLSELHAKFTTQDEKVKITFSKFALLRLKQSVLPGASGTHNACICVYHQNVNLMLSAIDIKHLNEEADIQSSDYHDCLKEIMCSEPINACHFDKYEFCPDIVNLK